MSGEVNANDVAAFLVEVAALVLLGMWAWRGVAGSKPAKAVGVIVVVGAAVVLWGLFAAPQATFDVPALAFAVKVLVLGGSVLAAYSLLPAVAIGYGVIVTANLALMCVGPFAR